MVPLPGSAAICAAPASLVPSGTTTDQRGVTIGAGGYCASGEVDAGAVQTDYALTFTTPAASPQTSGEAFPVAVTLSENGSGISGVSIPITLSSGATLSGSPVTETTGSNGVANYSLTVTNASQVNGLTLTAALPAPPTPTATSIFNLDPAISTVTGISPSTGSTAGGSSVTISGTNFNGATAVMFGVAPASSFTVNSKTSITAVSPAGTGVVDVTVTTPLGTTATSSADQFIYYVATSLIPAVTPGSTFIYNQQPTITAMVNPAGASGTLTATLDSSTSLTVTGGGGNFGITLPGTPLTLGSHTIALSFTGATGYGNSTGRITLTVNAFPLVVNTNADDQSPSTTGCLSSPEGTCTLRDALLTAGNLGAGNITFSSSMSITLTSGNTLSIPSNTTIQGLTSGGGATLTNLVTVNGGTSVQIFNVASGVTNAVIANLILTDGGIIGGNGGGIASQGTLTVTGSTFYNNAAEYSAGAIWNNGGTLTVSDSTFSQNGGGSSGSGGAIWNNGGTLTVTNSTFSDNSIYGYGPGGAIANNGTATVSNSTFSGNYTLGGVGGALYMGSGTLTVTNSVFTGNSAATDSGGGIEVDAGTLAVSNSVFSSNTGGDCIGSGCPTNGTNGNLLGVASAGLAALGNYGGPTQTMIPLPSSPAICAGTATPQGGLTLPATDQRGVAFGAGGYCPSGSVDAGAVQTDYSLTFTTEPPPTVTVGANFSAAVALDESGTAFGTAAVTIPLTLTGNGTLSGGSASTSGGVTNYTSLQVSTAGSGDTLTADLTLNGLTISAVSSSFTANDAGTTTTASDASATYSSSAQSVALSATVTSNLGAVNAGTVTFTVLKGSTPVGTATSGTVNAGTAGVSYTLPAGAIVGTYTIKAVYNAAGDFNASSDTSHTLTVNTAVTTTTASSASATYSASAQSVTLSATVTSSRGTVSAGTVTFTVLSGSTPVGTATSGTVTGGEVSASFRLPAGAAVGTDTIQAAYIGAGDFTASSDTSHLLTVNAAATTTTAANASVTYSTSAQSVKLSAAVASGAGTVNEGTVTFTVLNGSTPVGTATSGTVNTGSASANYSLPAGATGGTYTIRAVYNAAGSFITSSDTSHTLTVNQVIPSITWAAPAAITYGTALSASQLDATSPVAGTIAYTPALGAVLNAGSQTLSATLTPTDSTDFKTATASVTLTVNQAAQTITFTPPTSPVYYGISPITLGATGGASGAPVTFSIVSGPGSLSGTNNSILTVTGTGAIVIAAHQAGSVNFAAAPQVTRSITVLTPVPSTLTAPASGSLLTGASEVFTWSPGTGVTEYDLHLSAIAPGDSELYSSGDVTRTSAAVNGLPTNGETIYARLYSVINGATVYNDYTYSTGSLAQLTSPSPSSLLTATTVEFTWSAGTGVSQYDLHLSTVAPGDYDLYVSGHITGTSRVVTKLPTNGTTVYARLYSVIGGVTFYSDYTYSTGSLAQLTTPAPSSLLPNSTVEFAWSAGTGVSQYDLHLSTVAPGDYDLYVSGHITGTSRVVTKLPTNGTTIYARLYSVIGGVTFYNDYTYATGALAQLTSPAPSSLLPNSTVEFTWSAGTGVSQYDLHLSTVAPGDYDLYVSGHITGTSRVVTKLPTNGTTIYARLYSVIDGITFYNDYTYATGSAAVLTSPAPGSLLANSTEVFTWSAGTGVSQYDLHLSAVAPGDYDLYVSGHITGTATTVHGLPTNEAKIYARLYSVIDGITFYNDYTYKTE
jgi:hypothetical protein